MPTSQFGRSLRLISDGSWNDGALLTNPGDGTTLVSVAGLPPGVYLVAVSGAGSVAWVYDIQHQTSGSVVLHTQRRRPAAGNEDFPFPNWIAVADGDKIVVILRGAIVGEVQMSVFVQQGG